MARLGESKAGLRIMGDDLVPDEISKLLGCEPTLAHTKGQEIVSKSGQKLTRSSGIWSLKANNCAPEDLEGQIVEIFGRLSDDLSVWNRLASQFNMDIFVGFFMNGVNEGCGLSAKATRLLGERSVGLGLDIYSDWFRKNS